jgi:uncharacterized protein
MMAVSFETRVEAAPKIDLVVLQPTPFCNIDCRYCYLPERNNHGRMSLTTLEQSFRFLLEDPGRLSQPLVVAWHSGEPLAVPRSFYEAAFERLSRIVPPEITLEHWFQTNATLMNHEWCSFFKRWDIHIGISIDGPQWLHDCQRVDRSGRGTFSRVLRGVQLLQAENICFSTIAVLGHQATGFPEEIWSFFRGIGATCLAFNLEEIEGVHKNSSLDQQTSAARVESFFTALLELRDREAPGLRIREVDSILDGIRRWPRPFHRIENVPGSILCISWTGDVSTFSPELVGMKSHRHRDFVFGNVADHTLHEVLAHPRLQTVADDIRGGIEICKATCGYFSLCGGGAPSNKLHENGTFRSGETLACRLRIKAIAAAVLGFLERRNSIPSRPSAPIPERIAALQAFLQLSREMERSFAD